MANRITIIIVAVLVALGLLYWYLQGREDQAPESEVELSLSAYNQTQNVDASAATAQPGDTVVYTLTARNLGAETAAGYVMEIGIQDISRLATLTDAAGANYNAASGSLMWTPLDIAAGGEIEKTFTVRVKSDLPADADPVMRASFGNELAVNVSPQPVGGEQPAVPQQPAPSFQAPTTGPSAWFASILALAFTAGIILYRAAKRIQA